MANNNDQKLEIPQEDNWLDNFIKILESYQKVIYLLGLVGVAGTASVNVYVTTQKNVAISQCEIENILKIMELQSDVEKNLTEIDKYIEIFGSPQSNALQGAIKDIKVKNSSLNDDKNKIAKNSINDCKMKILERN